MTHDEKAEQTVQDYTWLVGESTLVRLDRVLHQIRYGTGLYVVDVEAQLFRLQEVAVQGIPFSSRLGQELIADIAAAREEERE